MVGLVVEPRLPAQHIWRVRVPASSGRSVAALRRSALIILRAWPGPGSPIYQLNMHSGSPLCTQVHLYASAPPRVDARAHGLDVLARHLRRRAPYATAILYTHTLTTVRCYHPALLHGYIVSTVVVHVVTVVPAALLAVPAGLLGPPVS